MSDLRPNFQSEVQKIKKEYERRAREIPKNRYSDFARGNAFIQQRREAVVFEALNARQLIPFESKKILDVGCGLGAWLALFKKWGAKESLMAGAELDEDKIREFHERMPASTACCCEASDLPWKDESFDIVIQATLFTSITDGMFKQRVAEEMMRVLKKGGIILWYDFRYDNPWNSHVKGIRSGEIRSLFKGCDVSAKSVTVLPFLARNFSSLCPTLVLALEKIPFLRSHYIAVIKKNYCFAHGK